MNVDVDPVGRNLDEQVYFGTALLDGRDAVRLGNRVRDGAVPDDAAIDEDVLRPAHGTVIAERRHVAVNRNARRVLAELQQVQPFAEQLEEALGQPCCGGTLEQPAAARGQRPADLRVSERHLRHEPRDLGGFGDVGLQEFAPRRQVEEEVGDLDGCALARPDLADRRHLTAVDAHLGAAVGPARAGAHQEMRHRRDARQRLAAEPERANRAEVVGPRNLAGGVPLDGQLRVRRLHPLAVVLDANQLLAAELDGDRDPRRTRIERVLDQFLDHRGRALDDFAGGDLIREVERKAVNRGPANRHEIIKPAGASGSRRIQRGCVDPRQRHHDADHPPELPRPAAGHVRQRHVHPVHAGEHGERQEDRRDQRQHLHDGVQLIRHGREMGVEDAGDPILEEHRLVREPHEVIVNVAEAIGQLLGDERKLAPRQPSDRVALRQHDLAQRGDVALEVENLPRQLRVRLLEHLGLELVEPLLQLVRSPAGSCRPARR